MNVEDLFTRLSFGELSGLSMSGNASGLIAAEAQPRLITFANDGLLKLYSKFVLRERELIIEQVDNYTNYHLLNRYAETNTDPSNLEPRYIKDVADPFKEDALRILKVFAEDGVELPLNDDANPLSVFTPNPIMLQVPYPEPGKALSLIYQARHVPLEYGVLGAEIFLPVSLEPALTAYIAGAVFSSMNGQEHTLKGREYMANYEAICNGVLTNDIVSTSRSTTNTKFDNRGFV